MFFIFCAKYSSFISKLFIDDICVKALAHFVKTMSGAMFHPLILMLLMSNSYFVFFLARLSMANHMNCIVSYSVEARGGG